MNYADPETQELYEETIYWLENMTRDEIEGLASWLVDNGYGVE